MMTTRKDKGGDHPHRRSTDRPTPVPELEGQVDVFEAIEAAARACCPAAVHAYPSPCPVHDEDGVPRPRLGS